MKYLTGKLKCQIAMREREKETEREKQNIRHREFRLLIYSIIEQAA